MASSEQKKELLKAKIAVALHDELGRVPKDLFAVMDPARGDILEACIKIGYI